MTTLIDSFIEVILKKDFSVIVETLSRIGVASLAHTQKEKTLYQSCHILHKKGHYFITHFKELFQLDGKPANFTEDDIARRNTIANMLSEWGLVELVDKNKSAAPVVPINHIKILNFKEKSEWKLEAKYSIGRKRT